MTPIKKAEEISKDYHFLDGEPKNDDAMQARVFDGALQMHEWTKQQMIKRACEQFKILINFFDNNKEFNADKFCEKWKKDIEEEL